MFYKSNILPVIFSSIYTAFVVTITIFTFFKNNTHGPDFGIHKRGDFPQARVVTFTQPAVTVTVTVLEGPLERRQDGGQLPGQSPIPEDVNPTSVINSLVQIMQASIAPPVTVPPPVPTLAVSATRLSASPITDPGRVFNVSSKVSNTASPRIASVDRSPERQKSRLTSLIADFGVASFGLMAAKCLANSCDLLFPRETVIYTPGLDGLLTANSTITNITPTLPPNATAIVTGVDFGPVILTAASGVHLVGTAAGGASSAEGISATLSSNDAIVAATGEPLTVTVTEMVSNVTITELATITMCGALNNATHSAEMITVTATDGSVQIVPVPVPAGGGGGGGSRGGGGGGGAGGIAGVIPGGGGGGGGGDSGGDKSPARKTITITETTTATNTVNQTMTDRATVTSTATLNQTETVLTTSTTMLNETTTISTTTLLNTTMTFNYTSTYNTTTTSTKTTTKSKTQTKTTTKFATAPPLPNTPFILEVLLPRVAPAVSTPAPVTPGASVPASGPTQTGAGAPPPATSQAAILPPGRFRLLKRLFRRQDSAPPNSSAVPPVSSATGIESPGEPEATAQPVIPEPPSLSFFLKLSNSKSNLIFTGESYALSKKFVTPVDATVFRYYNATSRISATVPTGGEDYMLVYAATTQNTTDILFNAKDVINFAPEVDFLGFYLNFDTGEVRLRGGSWIVCGEAGVVGIGAPENGGSGDVPPATSARSPPPARFRRRQNKGKTPQSPASPAPPGCTVVSVRAIGV